MGIIEVMIELNHRNACVLPEGLNLVDYRESTGNIVVVAPHPDDDVIGCGGLIQLHSNSDDSVFVIYVTNGAGTPAGKSRSKKAIVATRQKEALKGLKTVGGKGGIFLNYDSADVKGGRTRDVILDIFNILMILRPKIIYTASPFEKHFTHLASTQVTIDAIKMVPDYFPKLRGYGVWGSILAPDEFIETVDLTQVIDAKKRAIRSHESEITAHAYDDGTIGINRYYAVFADPYVKQKMEYAGSLLIMDELVKRPELDMEAFTRNLALHYLHDLYEQLPKQDDAGLLTL